MAEVAFKLSLEAAKALQVATQSANAFIKVEGSFGKATESARKYDRQMTSTAGNLRVAALEAKRLKDVMEQVDRVHSRTWKGVDLSISQTGRALARAGGTSQVTRDAEARSFGRFQLAQDLKADRAFSTFIKEQELAATEMGKLRQSIARNRITTEALDRRILTEKTELATAASHTIRVNNIELATAKRQKQNQENSTFITGAAGLIGAGVMASASYAQNYAESLDRIGAAGGGFEHQMRPLLSLGGFKGSDRMRDRVLSLSGAYGRDTTDISNSIYELKNNGSNFDKATQDKLFQSAANMTSTSGGDLSTNVTALTKLWQIYGDELGTVTKAQSKLQKAADESAASIQDMATFLPDVLPAARAFGHTFDEVAATLITATQVGGKTEKVFTGVRNIFLRMSQAEEEGIHLTGSLTEKFAQLSKINPDVLKKIFGDEAVSLMAALAEKSGQVADNLGRMQKVTSGEAFQKTVKMLGDAKIRDAGLRDSLTTNLGNVDILRAQDAVTRNKDLRYKMEEVGYEESVPLWIKSLPGSSALKALNLAAGKGTWNEPGWSKLGLDRVVNQKFDAGDEQSYIEANMLQLKYGDIEGTTYRNRQGKSVATDDDDVDRYARMLREGHNLSSGQYTQFRTLQDGDPTGKAAASYLAKLDEATKSHRAAAASLEAVAANLAAATTGRVGPRRNNHT